MGVFVAQDRTPTRAWGWSLAEVIIALLLLSMMILSVLAVFTALLSSSAKSNDQAIGVLYAEKILEQARANAKTNYPAFSPTSNGGQGFYSQDPTNQTAFFYNVTASDLDPVYNADPNSPGELWYLEAEVYWWSNAPGKSRTGYGALSVRQGRVTYISR